MVTLRLQGLTYREIAAHTGDTPAIVGRLLADAATVSGTRPGPPPGCPRTRSLDPHPVDMLPWLYDDRYRRQSHNRKSMLKSAKVTFCKIPGAYL
ncbi:hypothetical protein Ae406Ps2_6366 [Pseudonocardia sp. Ae406_Ps2]|nr:hypothetical protein Ae331Ps2_6289 [Pseudonocardia sp. Ae331_Ps2]OLL89926.1 hypothetical protein Ae406Ps2_6366 [Pseudonocardia sp. Ae406_Ps2]OLM08406.1 hypothetical protein Ae505Ps2_6112 [Pseudonocardia sp. Ae505_Ps2]OLM08414.1 hypothetical protein Ae505Ps2_6120 [Pseudonocardia sp. Ae505_Ps2]OLM08418.1 hypothetical protein Ae505Ps2_6124 [Pseudonocardia sp. Ae505_Ps2]